MENFDTQTRDSKIDTQTRDSKSKPNTHIESKKLGDFFVREETTTYPDITMYLYSNGAVSAYRNRYKWPVQINRRDQKLVERKRYVTDRDGRTLAYFIEADNYHRKPRPAFSSVYSYNPDGTIQAEYETQYDDGGNLTAENFSTFYPSGNIKTFQTVVHEKIGFSPVLTPSGQKPRTEADSIYIERKDVGGAPVEGQTHSITGTEFLTLSKDPSSKLIRQRQEVLSSMPQELLEMVKK